MLYCDGFLSVTISQIFRCRVGHSTQRAVLVSSGQSLVTAATGRDLTVAFGPSETLSSHASSGSETLAPTRGTGAGRTANGPSPLELLYNTGDFCHRFSSKCCGFACVTPPGFQEYRQPEGAWPFLVLRGRPPCTHKSRRELFSRALLLCTRRKLCHQ